LAFLSPLFQFCIHFFCVACAQNQLFGGMLFGHRNSRFFGFFKRKQQLKCDQKSCSPFLVIQFFIHIAGISFVLKPEVVIIFLVIDGVFLMLLIKI